MSQNIVVIPHRILLKSSLTNYTKGNICEQEPLRRVALLKLRCAPAVSATEAAVSATEAAVRTGSISHVFDVTRQNFTHLVVTV